jgi:hypothetical protein
MARFQAGERPISCACKTGQDPRQGYANYCHPQCLPKLLSSCKGLFIDWLLFPFRLFIDCNGCFILCFLSEFSTSEAAWAPTVCSNKQTNNGVGLQVVQQRHVGTSASQLQIRQPSGSNVCLYSTGLGLHSCFSALMPHLPQPPMEQVLLRYQVKNSQQHQISGRELPIALLQQDILCG